MSSSPVEKEKFQRKPSLFPTAVDLPERGVGSNKKYISESEILKKIIFKIHNFRQIWPQAECHGSDERGVQFTEISVD